MKGIDISAEAANALRELILKSQEAYAAYEETRSRMKKRYLELAGPIGHEEIVALRKDTNRVEVVPHREYLNDLNRKCWY
jgi:hypothetical protein